MMSLFWTPEAIQDRDNIYEYAEAANPAAALALDELISDKAGRLVDYPALGKPGRVAGTRCRICGNDSPNTHQAMASRPFF